MSSSANLPSVSNYQTTPLPVTFGQAPIDGDTLLLQIIEQLDILEQNTPLIQLTIESATQLVHKIISIANENHTLEKLGDYAVVCTQLSTRYEHLLNIVDDYIVEHLTIMGDTLKEGKGATYPMNLLSSFEKLLRALISQEKWKARGQVHLDSLENFSIALSVSRIDERQKTSTTSSSSSSSSTQRSEFSIRPAIRPSHFSFLATHPRDMPTQEANNVAVDGEALILQIMQQLDAIEKDTKTAELTIDMLAQLTQKMYSIAKNIALLEKQKESAALYTQLSERYDQWLNGIEQFLVSELDIMQHHIDEDKGEAYPFEVIALLEQPIRVLISQEKWKTKGQKLLAQLETLNEAVSIAHVNEQQKTGTTHIPFIGEQITLAKKAQSLPKGNLKNGYEKLNKLFVMKPISGDGHCLFRATLAYILEKWSSYDDQALVELFRSLDAKIADLNSPTLTASYVQFKETIENMRKGEWDVDAMVCDHKMSDTSVHFLRIFVCEHNRKYGNDVFSSHVASLGKTKQTYLTDMMSMRQPIQSGEHPEVLALSSLLYLNICVVDVAEYGKSNEPKKENQAFRPFKVHRAKVDLFLLYEPGHYNLGKLKNSSVEIEAVDGAPTVVRQSHRTADCITYAIEKGWIRA